MNNDNVLKKFKDDVEKIGLIVMFSNKKNSINIMDYKKTIYATVSLVKTGLYQTTKEFGKLGEEIKVYLSNLIFNFALINKDNFEEKPKYINKIKNNNQDEMYIYDMERGNFIPIKDGLLLFTKNDLIKYFNTGELPSKSIQEASKTSRSIKISVNEVTNSCV